MQAVFLDTGTINRGDIDLSVLESIGVKWQFFSQEAIA